MLAIEIRDENLELIAALNDNVRPLVKVPYDYFVYTDAETPTAIVTRENFRNLLTHVDPDEPYPSTFWTF